MITYVYKCPNCNKVKEVKHSIKETPKIICDICGTKMKRVILGGQATFTKKIGGVAAYHGEGKERKAGRKKWIKENPYYDKLPDYL